VRRSSRVSALFLFAIFLVPPVAASVDSAPEAITFPRVEDHAHRAIEVPTWDPASPQQLVRIDGKLHQRDAGTYYPVIPGRVVVGLAEGVESWPDVVARAIAMAPGRYAALAELKAVRTNHLGTVRLAVPEGTNLDDWCKLVFSTGFVRYAEVATYGAFQIAPDDPQYGSQWALNNATGAEGADVSAEEAWEITAGDPSIVVAVLDSGTDIDHEDLAANVWHNEDEIPDNGIDDDSNGYVDDWEGWDFHNNDNEPRPVFYHGTHVTGIVNAVTNNGIGIAGLAGGFGGPGVLGMALGVGDDVEDGDVIDEGLIYAADNGAHVITMAFSTAETQAINDALDYAYHTKGVFLDCSAGNGGSEVGYPARHPAVVAVASTTKWDNKSSFSNPGPEVEVAAPGSDILSTQMNDSYGISSGTSFAAPHVAAAAALMLSRNPQLTAPDIRQLLIESADDVSVPGFDYGTGHGRINAHRAVTLAATPDGIVRFPADEYHCGGDVDLFVADFDLAGTGTVSVTVSSDTEPGGETVLLSESAPGSGSFRGSIPSSYDAALPDGVLQMADGDTLVVEYLDLDDGQGGSGILKSDSATADCLAPWIADVRAEEISGTSAAVLWTTDEESDSRVAFGETVPPEGEVVDAHAVTDHRIDLADLSECTVYHYSAASADDAGNLTVEDNGGSYFHFETLADFGQGLQPCHQGRVTIDTDTVGCSSSLPVTVGDQDLNTDPGTPETVSVTVTSTSEPLAEILVLTETGPDTSIFSGAIPTGSGVAVGADGILQVAHGDLLTATYRDADDGTGQPRTSFDTASADCAGPDYLGVYVNNITDATARIEWITGEPATGYVDWGVTPDLGNQVSSTTPATVHNVTIGSFDECSRVYFRVVSTDAQGHSTVADADGAPFEFNGSTMQGVLFEDGFETDTGWTLEGEWERGAPQGLGTSPGDPTAATEGVNVIGHDLSGQGNYLGDYEINTEQSAVSPLIDLSSLASVELRLQRWVNVANRGTAYLEVTDGVGSWHEVWNSGTLFAHTESSWSEQVYDVSSHAGGNSAFQVRFRQGGQILGHHAGWNVDELVIRDGSLPAFGACGGCTGAPTFAGAATAVDKDPCAASGVTLSWSSPPAWGTGTGGSIVIYRDTQPGFVPSPANLVASGVYALNWTDSAPPSDVPLYYVARAENNETCSDGPANGGVTDGNLVYVAAIDATSQAAPGEVGDALRLDPVNQAHVRLQWGAAPDAARYHVYRSSSPDGGFARIAEPVDPLHEDPGAFADGTSWYYLVLSADACGNEE
jgi:subtilisin family serine protease